MNIDTGEIEFFDGEEIEKLNNDKWIRIKEEQMTEKQKQKGRVSLKDHRSELGRILTKNRKKKLKRKGLLK